MNWIVVWKPTSHKTIRPPNCSQGDPGVTSRRRDRAARASVSTSIAIVLHPAGEGPVLGGRWRAWRTAEGRQTGELAGALPAANILFGVWTLLGLLDGSDRYSSGTPASKHAHHSISSRGFLLPSPDFPHSLSHSSDWRLRYKGLLVLSLLSVNKGRGCDSATLSLGFLICKVGI